MKLFDYLPHSLKYFIREITLNRYSRRKINELNTLKSQVPHRIVNKSVRTISKMIRKKDQSSLLLSALITSVYNREYLANFKKLNSISLYNSGTKYRLIQEQNIIGMTYLDVFKSKRMVYTVNGKYSIEKKRKQTVLIQIQAPMTKNPVRMKRKRRKNSIMEQLPKSKRKIKLKINQLIPF